jgi:hypothetical protein
MYLQREVDVVGDTEVHVPKRTPLTNEKLCIIAIFCLTYRAGTVMLDFGFFVQQIIQDDQ